MDLRGLIVNGKITLYNFGSFWNRFWVLLGAFCFIFTSQTNPGAAPRRFRKKVATKQSSAGHFQANGSKMGPWNRKVGDLFDDIFHLLTEHCWDDFWMFFNYFWHIFGYFWCFILTASRIFLKPADLAKKAPRPHGSTFLRIRLFVFSVYFHDFPCISHDRFRFIFGSIPGVILSCFGIDFWSFGGLEDRQHVNKNRCENCHRKE